MKIFGLEKLSMVDYEGHLCCTIFFGGCNFRCPYCHNSDLVNLTNLQGISEEPFFEYLEKRKGIIDSVCISGGEPTLQKDLIQFIEKIKKLGLLIKLDTNGTNPALIQSLIEGKLVDYIAMDIKNSLKSYSKTAGNDSINLQSIKQSVDILKNSNLDYEFRITLVKGFHSKDDMQEIKEWLQGSERLYLQCFVDSGSCIKSDLEKVDKEEALLFKEILSQSIKNVQLRGY